MRETDAAVEDTEGMTETTGRAGQEQDGTSWHDVEETLLGSERRYTRREVAEQAGVPFPYVQRLWRALGFAEVSDEDAAFTDNDVIALTRAAELLRTGLLDEELAVGMARAMGQAMGRLAEWQANSLVERLATPGQPMTVDSMEAAVGAADQLVPELETLVVHTWRRHLAASGLRAFAAADSGVAPTRVPLAVGFADIASFGRLARELDEDQLRDVIEQFETTAADSVASVGGRIVKTLGEGVLFVADTSNAAAEGALRLVETGGGSDAAGDVRVGLAYGEALLRFGDVAGATVDVASRLTSRADAASVLVDGEFAAALEEAAGTAPSGGPAPSDGASPSDDAALDGAALDGAAPSVATGESPNGAPSADSDGVAGGDVGSYPYNLAEVRQGSGRGVGAIERYILRRTD